MPPPTRQFGVSPGTVINADIPTEEQLYITPSELSQLYGITVTEGHVRFAQDLVNAHTNRTSLWPEQYEERIDVPSDRQVAQLNITPAIKIIEAAGRYSYGRRDRRAINQVNQDYMAAIAVFGSPPRFTAIDVDQIDLHPSTGEIWLPTGFFLVAYTQIQIKYLAGFQQIPSRVKSAMAEILNVMCQKGVSDRVQNSVGRTSRRYSSDSFMTPTARQLLQPLVVHSLY